MINVLDTWTMGAARYRAVDKDGVLWIERWSGNEYRVGPVDTWWFDE